MSGFLFAFVIRLSPRHILFSQFAESSTSDEIGWRVVVDAECASDFGVAVL